MSKERQNSFVLACAALDDLKGTQTIEVSSILDKVKDILNAIRLGRLSVQVLDKPAPCPKCREEADILWRWLEPINGKEGYLVRLGCTLECTENDLGCGVTNRESTGVKLERKGVWTYNNNKE